jgi:HrpA-like RNA helicase
VHIHKNHAPGHILVFLPGQGEISEVDRMLRSETTGLDIFPLYSRLAAEEQNLALKSTGVNRKCILATNIAETSLTIDDIAYVVDSGLSRQMIHNSRLDMDMLELQPISQASARQRTGRAGRTMDGVCYRLYSKDDFDRMAPSTEPAVRREPVHAAVLTLLYAGHTKVIDFDWIDAPHPEAIARAAQDLQDWYISLTQL